ncbi:hypothetical protein [Alcanivorax sp. DP30]|uniref:hypothetical protein n=1 Tax=Alcanivorax sp. DP30 TaxID=2606217 RepID=UPI00136C4BC0|nr:hypothetical protein [Alcanivorax sp. DP30]MZR64499.1 hypothetical protein [Alcanivorax sp. DP30]
MKATLHTLVAALLILLLGACDSTDAPVPDTAPETLTQNGIAAAQWQQQSRQQFEQAAANWQQALVSLEQAPTDTSLATLRDALSSWYQTFTAQSLLLNARACQLDQQALLSRIDTWPLYPGYIDAMPQWPESGLISDPYLELNRKTLRIQHGATDPAEASLGFAAMFVVLNGTGDTPKALDHFQGDESNAPRRRSYLKLAGEQILADYQALLSSDIPLTGNDLDCAVRQLQQRHQLLADSADNDDELVIPPTVRNTVNDKLQTSLQGLPDDVANHWEELQPGIIDAIAASTKEGWLPITAWRESQSE